MALKPHEAIELTLLSHTGAWLVSSPDGSLRLISTVRAFRAMLNRAAPGGPRAFRIERVDCCRCAYWWVHLRRRGRSHWYRCAACGNEGEFETRRTVGG